MNNITVKIFTFFILILNNSIFSADHEVKNELLQCKLDAIILAQGQQETALLNERFLKTIETSLIEIKEQYVEFKDIHPYSVVAPNNLTLTLNDDFYQKEVSEKLLTLNDTFSAKITCLNSNKYSAILHCDKAVDIYQVKNLYQKPEVGAIKKIEFIEIVDKPISNIELDTKSEDYWIFTITDEQSNKHLIYFDKTQLKILKRID